MQSQTSSGPAPVVHVDAQVDDSVALVLAIARQDRKAFAELFTTFAPKVKGYMMRGGASAELAEDLTIETFVKLWQRAGTFDPNARSAAAWIFTVARNTRIDHWRQERHPDDLVFDPEPRQPSPEDHLASSQRDSRLRTAVTKLPADQINLLQLSYFEGLPHVSIAERLNMPLGTVKSRIRGALTRLRAGLGEAD